MNRGTSTLGSLALLLVAACGGAAPRPCTGPSGADQWTCQTPGGAVTVVLMKHQTDSQYLDVLRASGEHGFAVARGDDVLVSTSEAALTKYRDGHKVTRF